jgi:hypothetical protein
VPLDRLYATVMLTPGFGSRLLEHCSSLRLRET